MSTLIDQATSQLNFLLLSQRNMILVSAFALALATFKNNVGQKYIEYLVIILFSYAIAVGSKSIEDFNAYIKDAKQDGSPDPTELDLLNRWEKWVYFSYTLLGIIILILIFYADIAIFKYSLPFHSAEDKKKKRIN